MILHFSRNGPYGIKVFQTSKAREQAIFIPRKISILEAAGWPPRERPAGWILLY